MNINLQIMILILVWLFVGMFYQILENMILNRKNIKGYYFKNLTLMIKFKNKNDILPK